MPLALLPLLALDGAALFAWKKWAWAAAYAVGVAAFLLVMVTVPDSWSTVDGDYVRWVVVFAGFGVLAVGVWGAHAALERRKTRAVAPATQGPASQEPRSSQEAPELPEAAAPVEVVARAEG
jgi:hypothetical protein